MITLHSGGANGSDEYFGKIGIQYGVLVKHYYAEGQKTPHGNTPISKKELLEADKFILRANTTLQRTFPSKNDYVNNLIRRNYFQIKDSDAVYAISTITNNKVDGGTAWAVQMAIEADKPVYVYDQKAGFWFCFNEESGMFVFVDSMPAKLPLNFTGVGTREINVDGVLAIRRVYKSHFNN